MPGRSKGRQIDRDAMGRAISIVQASVGGELELAALLHTTRRSIIAYRTGKFRPSRFVCLQLARICRTLDGPDSIRTVEYWMTLGLE